jgi:hypothetical protein
MRDGPLCAEESWFAGSLLGVEGSFVASLLRMTWMSTGVR